MDSKNKYDFNFKYDFWVGIVNRMLNNILVEKDCPEKNIYKAINYSLMAGGKRIRPVLSLAVNEMLDGDVSEIIPYACSIELIHTYSLIHDDLPPMDDDDYRRGKPTNHKVYGEAMAILAGDALLTYAFELMTENILKVKHDVKKLRAGIKGINYIARAAGMRGMIGGQVVDLEAKEGLISGELLKYMHNAKTGAMIKVSALIPAIILDLDRNYETILNTYSEKIGLAFQIKDDILDVEGEQSLLGKKVGKDALDDKSTFVALYGVDKSKIILDDLIQEAVDSLDSFGDRAKFLRDLAFYIKERNH